MANNEPVMVNDELRFYYAGRMYRHSPYAGPDKGHEKSGIGFASIKRDRFVALEGSFDGGEIVTKPLKLSGATLHLNAKSDFGEIVVELFDPGGRRLARSKPIHRDSVDIPVEWADEAQKTGEPVTLRIQLENARIFALWCAH